MLLRNSNKRKRSNYEQRIDWHFCHIKMIEKAIEERREDYVPTGNTTKPLVKDPTASKAIAMATELPMVYLANGEDVYYPERWVKLYKELMSKLSDTDKQILKRRWHDGEVYTRTCIKMCISVSTYYYTLRHSVQKILPDAVLMGLITP